MSLPVKEYKTVSGEDKPTDFGNERILQHFLLHTIVRTISIENTQVQHVSWFYTVFTMLHGAETKFQMDEFKYCLFAFWKRYQLLQSEHKSFDMWNKFFQKITAHNALSTQHWNEQADQLWHNNANFDGFFIDIFRRMLLHQGFQDDNKPFYIGYVTAKYQTNERCHYIYEIKFKPKCIPPDPVHRYLYVGKQFDRYFSIVPHYDSDITYRIPVSTFQTEPCCIIFRYKKHPKMIPQLPISQ